MNRIVLVMTFISAFLFFSLISVNQVSLADKASAEEDQAAPMPPLQRLHQLPNMGDNFQKDINSNDVVSIGQERVIVENEVVNDAVVIGADLTVNGIVNGDAVCIGGDLTVGPQAVIKGDMVNIGGQLTVDPLAQTNGERVNIGGVFPFGIFKGEKGTTKGFGERFGMFVKILRLTIDSVFFILLLFLALLMTAFMPRQFDHIEEYLTNEFPRCTLLGIACMVGLPIVIFLFVISMVGILAVPFLLLASLVSCMMGYVVFGRVLGRKILANSPVMLQILIGLLLLHSLLLAGDIILLLSSGSVYAIIGHVLKGIGIVIFICVNFIGLGAVIYSVWGKRGIAQGQGDKPNGLSSMPGGANTATA
jgi:hypothetical protein